MSIPGLRVERWLSNAAAIRVDAAALDAVLHLPFVSSVALDEGGEGHVLQSLPLAGFAHAKSQGYRGAGITVAVLDTGVDRSHPDLAGAVVAEACFCTGCCAGSSNEAHGEGAAADDNGHGTNVAGIIASRGVAIAAEGGAPAASIIAIKVLNASNGFCCTTDIVAALEWVRTAHPEVDVVNMSLGTSALFDGNCDGANAAVAALATAVDALRSHGVVVIASSGNQGSATSMNAPACIESTVSVGAVWDEDVGPEAILCQELMTAPDRIACFSNASATLDLLAPGARVTSAAPMGLIDGRVGTSQAAAVASACAALLREAAPAAAVGDITGALRISPTQLPDPRNGLAYSRLDCGAALAMFAPTAGVASNAGSDAGVYSGASVYNDASIDAAIADASARAPDASTDAASPMEIDAATQDAIATHDATAAAEGGDPRHDSSTTREDASTPSSRDASTARPPLSGLERDASHDDTDAGFFHERAAGSGCGCIVTAPVAAPRIALFPLLALVLLCRRRLRRAR